MALKELSRMESIINQIAIMCKQYKSFWQFELNFNILIFDLILFISFPFLLSSCHKCYSCFSNQGGFIAIKGIDSIGFNTYSKEAVTDSVTHYLSLGFRIDTVWDITIAASPFESVSCAKSYHEQAIAAGDSCVVN